MPCTTHDGSTPLHAAVLKTHQGCVELLLANGADPSAKTIVSSSVRMSVVHINELFDAFAVAVCCYRVVILHVAMGLLRCQVILVYA